MEEPCAKGLHMLKIPRWQKITVLARRLEMMPGLVRLGILSIAGPCVNGFWLFPQKAFPGLGGRVQKVQNKHTAPHPHPHAPTPAPTLFFDLNVLSTAKGHLRTPPPHPSSQAAIVQRKYRLKDISFSPLHCNLCGKHKINSFARPPH